MKQTLFATRQRAEELIKEITTLWRQGNQTENLDSMESDPVFALLMTALAYQSNEIDDEIERLKSDVLEDFAQMLIPYELCRSTPAVVMLKTALESNVSEVEVNSSDSFTLSNTEHRFIPLFRTKIVNAQVKSIVRMDGRRWKVALIFQTPIKNLSGISFHIANTAFNDMKVMIEGRVLPLIKPWDYANLPLSDCFSIDSMLYNKAHTYNATSAWFDLFAQQNARLFYVDEYDASKFNEFESDQIDLVFEFFGMNENFVFDKTQLQLNCVPLVNVEEHSVDLSLSTPIVCVSSNSTSRREFMHLIRPAQEQINGCQMVTVRQINADRFNISGLLRLINCIITKFSSDFYAYQNIHNLRNGGLMHQLYDVLKSMADEVAGSAVTQVSGTYLMLDKLNNTYNEDSSLKVRYLTTYGGEINKELDFKSQFLPPPGFDAANTVQIIEPIHGRSEINGSDAQTLLSQYYMVTNDRLVTPMDIKMFCYKELMVRYGIVAEMVSSIKVGHRQQIDRTHCGYEVVVDIMLIDNVFVKRSFENKLMQAELVIQKMIEVRSTGIYPVQVSIRIN